MSAVRNEARRHGPLLDGIRAQLEHRATWLYLLCDEARKQGLEWESFAPAAIRRCGLRQGASLVERGGTTSLKGLHKVLFTWFARRVFEMEVLESTDNALSIDFHYCPLVKAWSEQGATGDEIGRLCDIAMCGDHGIGEAFGCVLDLPSVIAKGGDRCRLRYRRKEA